MIIPTDDNGKSFGIYCIEDKIKALEEIKDKEEHQKVELRLLKVERDLLLILYDILEVNYNQVGMKYEEVQELLKNSVVYVFNKDDNDKMKFVAENMESIMKIYKELMNIVYSKEGKENDD